METFPFFLSFLRTTVEKFSCIVISILPTYQTTFPVFTENVSFTAKPAESREEVLKQILWNNQFVRINDKPVFNRRLFSKGIVFISDILTNNGKLKPWPSFAATGLTLVDFFSLQGIFDSLPSPWKSLISSNRTPIVSHGPPVMQHTLFLNGKSFLLDSINSKKLYWELVEMTQVYPSARHKYTTLFHNHSLDWETIYLIPHVVTIDTMQYKILPIQNSQSDIIYQ